MPDDSTRPYDVAIAGAGLAGGSLALRLARAGVRVALLDPGTFPRDKLCGEYLSPEGGVVLDRLGLSLAVARLGFHPIRRVRLTTPRGRQLQADVTGPDDCPGLGLSRSSLDDLLVSEARRAGAEVFEATRVGGPILADGRVVGLHARHPASGPREIRATITIAANGRHSALVRETGTTRTRSLFRPAMFGLKRHLSCPDPDAAEPAGTVGLHLVPGGYVGTSRVEGGLLNLCGLLPESLLRRYRGDLDQLAEEHFATNPRLESLYRSSTPVGAWKTVSGVRVEVSAPRLPGILFAGDCQGTVDPLGGQGMTMALLGAEGLAPTILSALASGCVDSPRQLAHQRDWRRRFDGRIRLCRVFHHVLVNPWLIDAAATSQAYAPKLMTACYNWTRDPIAG